LAWVQLRCGRWIRGGQQAASRCAPQLVHAEEADTSPRTWKAPQKQPGGSNQWIEVGGQAGRRGPKACAGSPAKRRIQCSPVPAAGAPIQASSPPASASARAPEAGTPGAGAPEAAEETPRPADLASFSCTLANTVRSLVRSRTTCLHAFGHACETGMAGQLQRDSPLQPPILLPSVYDPNPLVASAHTCGQKPGPRRGCQLSRARAPPPAGPPRRSAGTTGAAQGCPVGRGQSVEEGVASLASPAHHGLTPRPDT
jgi:hypothetical protein